MLFDKLYDIQTSTQTVICGQFYVKIAGTIQQKPTFIHTLLVAVCHFTFSVVLIKKKIN